MVVSRAALANAYATAASRWATGPSRIYRRLAAALVASSPVALVGRRVLDLGSGTGAATEAIAAVGGRPIAVDASLGMLSFDRDRRPPRAQADVAALPFGARTVGAVVAAFVLNHVDEPATVVREAARVTGSGGVVLASSYASDDAHPVKAAVEAAMVESGWTPEPWYDHVRSVTMPAVATEAAYHDVLGRAGLTGTVERTRVRFPELSGADLVEWRLGMAQYSSHLAALDGEAADRLRARSLEVLGEDPPVLERSVLHLIVRV